MYNTQSNNTKKRKNATKSVKNTIKNDNNNKNHCDFCTDGVALYAWVKTLLSVHDTIPNIIKLIDKMVSAKAGSAVGGSCIFGDYKNGTYNQIEQLLDLQDRKLSLINLYTLIENMVSCLPKRYKEFVNLKFYKHKTMQYIAADLEIDERTAFRWSNTVLQLLVEYCVKNNWSVLFIQSQTKSEPWLMEHFNKIYKKLKAYNKA